MGTHYYKPTDHTAEEWRAMAKQSYQREQESWERSDTDGFLSQWAHVTMAQLYNHLAELAETGGRTTLRWLFDADGNPVDDWSWVDTRYGATVRVGKGDGVRWFNPSEARKGAQRAARDRAKGFTWGLVETDVVVRLGGGLHPSPINERKLGSPLTVITPEDYEDYPS
ncbi:hypothetical protein J4U01_gp088 [Mycobacterium phage Kumao]|uniref:Uncharacterized protein n=1 Tax=Mycobacterium phage Kumao TaxID=2041344 RepID=A0A2D1GPY8_9CAUD|nr:hypothetical protein J4U01_gp088 [Mycobacterium phage Kumao]ATN94070.1 hypothetical protein SEA_KUMAO_108 [Mycobacterium phage Kumao]